MAVKIHELRAKRAAVYAQLKALQAKDNTDEGMSAEDVMQFNSLGDVLADHDSRIARAEAVLSSDAADAKAVKDEDESDMGEDDDDKAAKARLSNVRKTQTVPATVAAPAKKDGSAAVQMMLARAYDRIERKSGDQYKNGADMIKGVFGESAVTKTLEATGTGPNGAVLIPTYFLAELIEYLRSKVVMRQVGATKYDLSGGNLTIPRQAGPATASWIAENADITASSQTFDSVVLAAHKLVAMTPISNDLIRRSPISAEGVIRNDLARQIALSEDLAFIRGSGASGGSPTGMLNLAQSANTFVATAADAQSVLDFLSTMINAVEIANVDITSGVWVMHAQVKNFLRTLRNGLGYPFFPELQDGMLLGFPVSVSNQIPLNLTSAGGTAGSEIYFAAASELMIADALAPTIEVSREASFIDPSSGSLVSAWNRDLTVFRVIEEVDFNVKHIPAIAVGLVDSWKPVA